MSIKVGILEEDVSFLQEISTVVKSSSKLEYVMAASSAEQFLKYFNENTAVDILLTSVKLPGMSGFEAIARVRSICPEIEIVVLSSYRDSDTIFKALRAGASGYLLKDASFEEIEQKLILAYEGNPALSPSITNRIIAYFRPATLQLEEYALNAKENRVVKLLIEGLSYKLIASELKISIDGVRYHVKKVYKKLNINSRPELMKMFIDGKLI